MVNQKKKNMNKIMGKGKALYLAYDQGLEHGPEDFNDKNVDPKYIIDIAKKGKYTGIIFHKGIAEAYGEEIKKSNVPLIVKLNGKTKLYKGEPISSQLCTVREAINLGASAVGFTIYIGSKYETKMLEQFEEIRSEAHKKSIPVIVWVYPRGKSVKNKSSKKLLAYAARVGLEIGADIIKIRYNGKKEDLQWAAKSAGKTKIVIAGGTKKQENNLIKDVKDIMNSGAIGMAIGRNIWQSKKPLELTREIKKVIWKNEK